MQRANLQSHLYSTCANYARADTHTHTYRCDVISADVELRVHQTNNGLKSVNKQLAYDVVIEFDGSCYIREMKTESTPENKNKI